MTGRGGVHGPLAVQIISGSDLVFVSVFSLLQNHSWLFLAVAMETNVQLSPSEISRVVYTI